MSILLRLLPVLLISLVATNCYSQKKADTAIAVHYQTNDFDAAIFPATYTSKYEAEINKTRKRFTPSTQDINKAELALKTHIKELQDTNDVMIATMYTVTHSNLKKYRRQYFGYNKKGHRILFINSFCGADKRIHWLNELMKAYDGGSCFWSVKFDLDTGKLFDLTVNGDA